MTKKQKSKTITYPLRMDVELYKSVQEAASLHPIKPSKAAIMRQALEIGLKQIMKELEQ